MSFLFCCVFFVLVRPSVDYCCFVSLFCVACYLLLWFSSFVFALFLLVRAFGDSCRFLFRFLCFSVLCCYFLLVFVLFGFSTSVWWLMFFDSFCFVFFVFLLVWCSVIDVFVVFVSFLLCFYLWGFVVCFVLCILLLCFFYCFVRLCCFVVFCYSFIVVILF